MRKVQRAELFVVGIASSAGGLPPLMELLEHASCHENMTFVLVPHLHPDHETQLPSLLKKVSNMKSELMRDGMSVERCHLMILPPGKYATVDRGVVRLTDRPESGPNHCANVLFESLARSYGANAIGVVLSGLAVGADGSEGVIAIKNAGGHTYAQTPQSALYPMMPELAIATGRIDSVMTAAEIGKELTLVNWASA